MASSSFSERPHLKRKRKKRRKTRRHTSSLWPPQMHKWANPLLLRVGRHTHLSIQHICKKPHFTILILTTVFLQQETHFSWLPMGLSCLWSRGQRIPNIRCVGRAHSEVNNLCIRSLEGATLADTQLTLEGPLCIDAA